VATRCSIGKLIVLGSACCQDCTKAADFTSKVMEPNVTSTSAHSTRCCPGSRSRARWKSHSAQSGDVTQAAATRSLSVTTTIFQSDGLGLKPRFTEGREVQPYIAILLGNEVATGSNSIGFGVTALWMPPDVQSTPSNPFLTLFKVWRP